MDEKLIRLINDLKTTPDATLTRKECLLIADTLERLYKENERYKDINQGLLEVQLSLRNKEKEYQQWFEAAAKNLQSLEQKYFLNDESTK